ncbi:cell division cycle protein 37 [Sarotherodon galilaeus]
MTFPADFFGSSINVDTLALVVPDIQQSYPMILVGTNTLDVAYSKHCDTHSEQSFLPTGSGYIAVYKILQCRHVQNSDDQYAPVILKSDQPHTITAGQTTVLEGCLVTRLFQGEKAVILEHPTSSSLPGGLMVKTCLVDLPQRRPCFLPVVVSNESDHEIHIPARAIIAEISAFQEVISKEQHIQYSDQSTESLPPSQPQYNFGDSPLTPDWKERIVQKLNTIPEVFAKHDLDFGRTDKVKHQIKLSDPTPFKQRPRPIHPQDFDAVRKHLQELLDSGVIRESDSPFASPIVVARKKNGSVRLCIDYRKLNLQTIKDAYALPKLEDTFSALAGSKWFTVLDLKSGYYQIEMEEKDKAKTAFVCPLGFWEFNRMPQGITNAPSTFQRLMEKCMGELNLKEVLVFIDDLIVFAPTLEEHETRLMKVLTRLKDFGLKLSLEKCMFFQTSVKYLGHVVSQAGVETDPDKISTLTSWPVPKNLKELRSFLGFAGYYRRFVQGYSAIVKPLHDLTAGYPPSQKKLRATVKPENYLNPKEPFGGRWTQKCQQAFESIIDRLTSAPVLAFADPRKPYILHTDASATGLGAVLYQEQDGKNRVVAYASRGLSRSESKYPAHKLEFLALKWAVTEKFHDYLYGTQFTVVTDSNPLTYLLSSAKLDATGYRWLSALSTFTFKLIYRAGKQNSDADGLSRRPHGELTDDPLAQKERERIWRFARHHLNEPDYVSIDQHTIKAVCDRHLVYSSSTDPDLALVLSMSVNVNSLPDSFTDDIQFASMVLPQISTADLAAKQRLDPVIRHVIAQVERGESPPPLLREELPELPLLLREVNKLELHNTLLVRKRQVGSDFTYQLVLPEEYRPVVLHQLHDQMGHMGIDRTLDLVRSRFYWPKMTSDVVNKIRTTPYHPRSNPVERFNRTLLDMLGTLTAQQKSHWKDFVKPLVHAYNCTRNDVTGFSPYELMFGRQPRLPVDLAFGLPLAKEGSTSHTQYVERLKSHLEESYKLAIENSEKVMKRNKDRFDKNVTASQLNVGDRVLVRNVRVRGKHKLADKWESSVYIVVKKAGNLPVYTVRPEGQDKPLRTLHRDLLLPCGYLPPSEKEILTKQKRKMPVLPASPVYADDNDEEELISYLPVPFSAEPVTFTTTIDLPNTSQPVPVINQPDVPVVLATEEENAILSEEPVPVEEEQAIDNETLEAGFEPVDLAEPSHDEESLSSDSVTPEASSNNLSQHSPTESEPLSPEAEPPLRHSTRTRNPPDRLQYIKPGKPLLKSVQTFLHGLSSVFSFALQADEEEETMPSYLSQPVIRCQPSPCTRTSMGLGGESVTTVISDPTSASPFIVAGINPV